MTRRPTLNGGTSRAGAATSSAAPTRAGTVVRNLETHAAAVTHATAAAHGPAAAHMPVAIRVMAARAGSPVPIRARILAPVRAGARAQARAAFPIPALIPASAPWGPAVPTRGRAQAPAHA
jgi:hypothetical protein